MLVLLGLKEVLHENDRLKDEIHQVIQSALKSYYELSKYQHHIVQDAQAAEIQIANKIDESMVELKDIQLS